MVDDVERKSRRPARPELVAGRHGLHGLVGELEEDAERDLLGGRPELLAVMAAEQHVELLPLTGKFTKPFDFPACVVGFKSTTVILGHRLFRCAQFIPACKELGGGIRRLGRKRFGRLCCQRLGGFFLHLSIKLRDLAGKTHALFDELLHLRSASSDRLSRQSGASGFVDRFKICILKCLGKSSALLCDLGVQIRRGFSERFGTGSAFPFVCLRL